MNILSLFGIASEYDYIYSTTDAAAAGVATGIMVFMFIFVVATYIIVSILLARIFKKAGVAGWKAWVPVYNTWTTLELGDQKGWWALVMLFPVVNLVASVFLYIAMYTIGLRLGKEGVFLLWAVFLPIVWYAWLAFDDSTWGELPATATESAD